VEAVSPACTSIAYDAVNPGVIGRGSVSLESLFRRGGNYIYEVVEIRPDSIVVNCQHPEQFEGEMLVISLLDFELTAIIIIKFPAIRAIDYNRR
jgi:hypothetical protein